MVKKMKAIAIVALMLFGVVALTACTPKEDEIVAKGTFYSLQEAYDEGLLTVENLQSIANYHNNGTTCLKALSNSVTEAIKEDTAIEMHYNEPSIETKASDFNILKYYGTYNDCVAVIMNDPYHDYPAVDLDITGEIAGVQFHYRNQSKIVIWKRN